MNSAAPIEGIFVPNMVPLDEQGRINEPELRRYIEWLIAKGVHGLYPNGSTSEFVRFTPQERRRIIEITVDQAAGRVPVLAGAAEANVGETLAACEYYHGLGVRAVAIVSPIYYRLSPDNIYAYFAEIAAHTPVDVTIYNMPMLTSPIDVPTVVRLAEEFPRIVAIKDSSGDVPQMMRLISAIRPQRPEFAFLTGWDNVLVPMLVLGCNGGTNASAGVVPEVTRALFDATRGGRLDEARRRQYRLLQYVDALFNAADFPEGFRIGAAARGFRMGRSRQPLSERQSESLRNLARTLETMLAEDGFESSEPPTRSDSPLVTAESASDRAVVQRVVQEVLQVLAAQQR
ncbi:MAG: dihydrodipicolinate synthase family protein [Thermogutta sp.]|nr:dihydrodipicolinate synthase family protein [Thermogutta sp.]